MFAQEQVSVEVDRLRVLVADDQPNVRYALRVLLQLAAELNADMVGEVTDVRALPAHIESLIPDILLLDWHLPGLDQTLIGELRLRFPRLIIIVLSVRPEMDKTALEAGAHGFVCKGDPVENLITAIRSAATL